jgi:hypothetical protein
MRDLLFAMRFLFAVVTRAKAPGICFSGQQQNAYRSARRCRIAVTNGKLNETA